MNGPRTRTALLAVLTLAAATAHAGSDCDVPVERWQPRAAVEALAERNGWQTDRLKIDDGCYEIKGRDAEGFRFKAKLDPATLEVVKMKREQDKHRDRLRPPDLETGSPPGED